MEYLNLLVDVKKEFSIYLVNELSVEINKAIYSLYNNCKNNSNDILSDFQEILADIPKWNNVIILSETTRISEKIIFLDDLITAVFISNMRLLCSVKNKKKQISVRVPKTTTFIHKCYIEIAKQFWSYTYLFNENINKLEIQKNKRQIDYIIKTSIEDVIRKLLPMKTILDDYLETNFNTETENINQNILNITENKKKNTETNEKQIESDIYDEDDLIMDEEVFIKNTEQNIIDEPNELYNQD